MNFSLHLMILSLAFPALSNGKAALGPPVHKVNLPKGFRIELFQGDLPGARQLAVAPSGTVFVGTKSRQVFAIKDRKSYIVARNLKAPTGVALFKSDLYVADGSRILRIPNIEKSLAKPPTPQVVYEKLPAETHHGWRYIGFGPDGLLYIPIGAPCNVCLRHEPVFATLTRMRPDGTGFEIVAHGVRNSVGLTWHPDTKKLWFTDNGADWMGDDIPPCELNRIDREGENFGFPYCHGGEITDQKWINKPCSDYKAPAYKLGAHVAPLGLKFASSSSFPTNYRKRLFIAEHGSWNRSKKAGYRIVMVDIDGDVARTYEPFATGWLDEETQTVWGRPVDIHFAQDGSMLVSDDLAGAIYRITSAQ